MHWLRSRRTISRMNPPTPTPQIIVLGSSNSDYLMKGPRFPRPGETLKGSEFLAAAGGKGANQAVAAARLGVSTALISAVGADDRGRHLMDGLRKEGLDLQRVIVSPEHETGAALVLVDAAGEKIIVAIAGANAALDVAQVEASSALIRSGEVLLTQFEAPLEAVLAGMRLAREAGLRVVLDPAPALETVPDELFDLVDAIRPNAHEAAILTGMEVTDRASATRAARALRNRGITVVAVQAGSEGNVMLWEDEEIWLPKVKVSSVDATGAGDAFAAALAVALVEKMEPRVAAHFCNSAAALTTLQLGAQTALPTRAAVEALMKQNYAEG